PGLPLHRKKKQKPPPARKRQWSLDRLKIPALIVAALIVGLLFGLPLLQVVTNFSPDTGADSNTVMQEQMVSNPPAAGTVEQENTEREELTLDVVQAGAFTSDEAGQEMEAAYAEEGFPALLHEDTEEEMVYLYVGMTDEGQAEEDILPEMNDQDVFVKTVTMPSPGGDAEEATAEFESVLVSGLTATAPGASGEDAEDLAAELDLDALSQVTDESDEGEELIQGLQSLKEDSNAANHENWMETTFLYDAWVRSL
ncbi:hypothetical protein PY710_15375, partial [Listeria monocytogenes]